MVIRGTAEGRGFGQEDLVCQIAGFGDAVLQISGRDRPRILLEAHAQLEYSARGPTWRPKCPARESEGIGAASMIAYLSAMSLDSARNSSVPLCNYVTLVASGSVVEELETPTDLIVAWSQKSVWH